MRVRTTYKSYNGISKKGTINMKKRTVLTMILAVTIISGILTGCGEKKASVKEPSAKAEQLSIKDNKKKEIATDSVTINVLADKGWDADSTPAILHITSKDVEFCHAVTADAEGGKGTTTITLAEGKYDVEFISPLNHDGSAYEIYDMGAVQEVTVEFGTDMTVDCEMKQIPAEQVTDEMIQDIVTKTQAAVEKGDGTLKGDAGKATLDKLAANVQNSPNASKETKDMSNTVKENTDTESKQEETVKTEAKAETTENNQTENNTAVNNHPVKNNTVQDTNTAINNPAVNTNQQNNATVNNNQNNTAENNQPATPVQPTQPSAPVVTEPEQPVHTHTWAEHVVTTQEWIPNIVTVPDYEEQTTYVWVCNCGAAIEYTEDDYIGTTVITPSTQHSINHVLAGEPANGHEEARTTQVQIGSHTEDQGHYETKTTVDYRYCTGCGTRQ